MMAKHKLRIPNEIQDQIVYDSMVEHIEIMKSFLKDREQGVLSMGVFKQTRDKDIAAIKQYIKAFKLVRDYYTGD
jgi:CO dehydrogenase/acetyl-CoA synthase beta subunit